MIVVLFLYYSAVQHQPPPPRQHRPQSYYLHLFHQYESQCKRRPLLIRESRDIEWKPWSFTPLSFTTVGQNCSTIDQVQDAIRFGVRTSSNFVPHGCDIHLFSPPEACSILSKFSHVTFIGDSLTRHHYQGTLMILRGDLRNGAAALLTSDAEGYYEKCQCDGQFSEHALCRKLNYNMFTITDPHAQRLCFDSPSFQMRDLEVWQRQTATNAQNMLKHMCSSDPRPRVLVLQGGLHFDSDPNKTLNRLICPYLNASETLRSTCDFRLYVIWMGLTSQSKEADRKYPRQSYARKNNDQLETVILQHDPRIIVVDYVNLTIGALDSDGVHFLSDVNLFRATSILSILDKVI